MAKNRIPPPATINTLDDLVNYQGVLPSTLTENQDLYSTERNLPFEKLGKYDTGLTRLSGNQEHYRAENQKGWGLLPTAAGRLIASTITKTLEGAAAMTTGFSENALSKEIADAEQHILNEWFPVYKSQGMESDSLMERLKEPGWWASTATDGAAFMLSAIVGSKGINAVSKLGLAGKLAKGLGASDDILMQMDKLTRSTVGKVLGLEKNGVGAATAYGAFNEAFFESKGVIDQVKTQLSKDKYGTEFDYLNPEQQADVMQAAGKAGQQTFWGNLPVLLLTERIFNETILGNFFGLPEASAFSRIIKEGDQFKLNALTKGQRAALYGLPFAANIPTEMFQENYQLAVSNYFTKKATGQSTAGMLEGILGEMGDNFSTIEGKESMFLGGLLGGLGASASLSNIGKQDKYANQYLDILNGHYGTLNKAASTYFQKDADGKILFENGMPKLKSQKDFDKEFEAITNNFEKYQIMSELRTAAELGDTSAAELYDIAVNDRFSETMFQLFQNPDSTQLVDTLIDSYAEKYAQEFEEMTGKKADKQTKVKELKDKAERMQSLYNLAETYYQVEGQPASLPMQYHSLFKQDYFKQKAKEFREKSNEVLSQLPIEDKLKIEDAINKPNKNSNTIIDAVLDNADFSKMDGVTDKVDTKANVAKALSFQSLYNLERQRFEKEFTKEEFYKKANEKVQEEAIEAEEKAKKQAVVDEARRKRAEEIAKQEAAKKAAKTVTPAKPVQTTQPVQPTAPVTSETSTVVQESTSAPEIPGINRETIEDYFKNNDGKAATTIAREIDTPIENVKFWLDKLVEEGKLIKKGNNRYYKVSSEESQVEPDNTDTEDQLPDNSVPEIAPDIEPEIPFTIIADPTDKQVRTQNDFVLATEALSEGHNVLANRVVQMEKIIEGNVVQRVNKDGFVLDENANTAAMHSNVKKGDTIQMSVPIDFMETPMYVDNKNDRTITFREHLSKVAPENYRQELIDNLPIKISHNGIDLGFVHRVDWINDTNLVEDEFVSFEEQKALLREFREQFIDATNSVATDLTVDTEITFKGPGKLARDISYKPVSEAAPSFPIAVVTGNRTVKTMDGKVITISHDATPGQAGFLYKDKFFVAKRKQLTDEDKQTLKELLLEPVKSVNKIASMVYASTIADTSKIQAALRNQKTPNNLRLGINKTSFYIYDHSTATVYNNSVEKLDEYLAQELVANIIPSKENTEWASNNLLTNIREVKADYDGNVEPTIFVHNVVRFKLPKKQLSERVVPEVSTEPVQTEIDAIERRRQERRGDALEKIGVSRVGYDGKQRQDWKDAKNQDLKIATNHTIERLSKNPNVKIGSLPSAYANAIKAELEIHGVNSNDKTPISEIIEKLKEINDKYDAELKALENNTPTNETVQGQTAEANLQPEQGTIATEQGVSADIEDKKDDIVISKQEGFKNAGEQSKKENNSNAIADYLLQNAKVGDTLTDKNGEGYEITEVNNRKDGSKEVVLVPFELIDGKIDYSYSGTKLISEKNKKTASDLYEFSYTNSNGERINETYTYNAKAEIQSLENNAQNKPTEQSVTTDIEAKKADIERRRQEELFRLLPQDKVSGGSFDFTAALSIGIPEFYQQMFDMIREGKDSIAGVKEKSAPLLQKLYNEGKLKDKKDVWLALNPEANKINERYNQEIAALIQNVAVDEPKTITQPVDTEAVDKKKEKLKKKLGVELYPNVREEAEDLIKKCRT